MKPKSNRELQAYFAELTNTLGRDIIYIPESNRELKKEIKSLKKKLESARIEVPEFFDDTVRWFEMLSDKRK